MCARARVCTCPSVRPSVALSADARMASRVGDARPPTEVHRRSTSGLMNPEFDVPRKESTTVENPSPEERQAALRVQRDDDEEEADEITMTTTIGEEMTMTTTKTTRDTLGTLCARDRTHPRVCVYNVL